MATADLDSRRILVVDDNPAIHEDFRKVLCAPTPAPPRLAELEAHLFDEDSAAEPPRTVFELSSALQGQEAVEEIRKSVARGRPYAMAFVDMRMPPGWDGLETIERMWDVDPRLQIVICTAYSDRSWSELRARLGNRDGLLVLKKPFDSIEVMQLAQALTERSLIQRQLEQRNLELLELHRFRDEMSAMLVHDLKGPLTAILSSLEFADGALRAASIDAEVLAAVEDSRAAGTRMLRLLGNLLAVASFEAGRLGPRLTTVPLAALVAEIVAQRRSVAHTRGVSIQSRVASEVVVSVDLDLVTRAMENILDNALRYTPRGGEIVITAESRELKTRISIGNTGPAVPREERSRIFEKYGQGCGAAGRMNLGLGLYFCRLVAEAHDGRIWVEESEWLPTIVCLELGGSAPQAAAICPIAGTSSGRPIE